MKNKLKLFGFSVLVLTAIVMSSAGTQQQKEKNQKEHKQNKPDRQQDKKNQSANAVKNNRAQPPGQQNKEDNPGKAKERGKSDDRGNGGNNAAKNNANNNNRNDQRKSDYVMTDGFRWDRQTFKDRDKYRKQEKVTICHKVNNDAEPAVTIKVSKNALNAHMNHGDVMGDCPEIKNSRYSNVFLRNRTDYYNTLQNHYEQVTYSQSILDYALARLTSSRQQLISMQNNNLPAADIQRKQAAVIELEQNVSLLESLIGVAANLVVNKLNN